MTVVSFVFDRYSRLYITNDHVLLESFTDHFVSTTAIQFVYLFIIYTLSLSKFIITECLNVGSSLSQHVSTGSAHFCSMFQRGQLITVAYFNEGRLLLHTFQRGQLIITIGFNEGDSLLQ